MSAAEPGPAWTGTQETRDLMQLAEAAAVAAAELIADVGREGRLVTDTKSSPTDVVTATDRAAEQVLRATLRAARPDDGLYGEEAGGSRGRSGITWVLDPIDGTVSFVYGLPGYSVSVAAVTGDPALEGGWHPVAGCVLAPATGQVWTAGRGHGAFLNGHRLRIGPPPEPAQALIGTGFSYSAERRAEQARVVAALLPRVRDIRRLGSAAMEICMVAAGQLDGYYEQCLNSWDFAAARLIVTEAGGVVRGLGGAAPGADMVVAAAPLLCDRLVEMLVAAGAGA